MAQVVAATGVLRNAIVAWIEELESSGNEFLAELALRAPGSTRRSGGGRKAAAHNDPTLVPDFFLALLNFKWVAQQREG